MKSSLFLLLGGLLFVSLTGTLSAASRDRLDLYERNRRMQKNKRLAAEERYRGGLAPEEDYYYYYYPRFGYPPQDRPRQRRRRLIAEQPCPDGSCPLQQR